MEYFWLACLVAFLVLLLLSVLWRKHSYKTLRNLLNVKCYISHIWTVSLQTCCRSYNSVQNHCFPTLQPGTLSFFLLAMRALEIYHYSCLEPLDFIEISLYSPSVSDGCVPPLGPISSLCGPNPSPELLGKWALHF